MAESGEDLVGSSALPAICNVKEAGSATPEDRKENVAHAWVRLFSVLREGAPVGSARKGDTWRLVSDETAIWTATTPPALSINASRSLTS